MRDECFVGGETLEYISNVASWEICSQRCRQNKACTIWTWLDPRHDNKFERYACELKTEANSETVMTNGTMVKFEAGCISGHRSCIGTHSK